MVSEQGLAFIEREHVLPNRNLLRESHARGRPSRLPKPNTVNSSVVYCNSCVVAQTQSEEEPGWTNWIDKKVFEDEALDLCTQRPGVNCLSGVSRVAGGLSLSGVSRVGGALSSTGLPGRMDPQASGPRRTYKRTRKW